MARPFFMPLFTNVLEVEFCELRLYRILGSSLPWGCAAHTALYLGSAWNGCTSNFACTEFSEVTELGVH
jgi:hypothetical protein